MTKSEAAVEEEKPEKEVHRSVLAKASHRAVKEVDEVRQLRGK